MDKTSKRTVRLAPHSIEAEEAVLGSILINPEAIAEVADLLKPDDFFEVKHGWIWEAMGSLRARKDDIDNLTLVEELRRLNRLDDAGGPPYITYLINNTPTHIYAETYARIVYRAAVRRRLLQVAGEIATLARDDNGDIYELVPQAQAKVANVLDTRLNGANLQRASDLMSAYFDHVEQLHRGQLATYGLPTGFSELDELTGGLTPGQLVLIAARPGMGKTALALNIAQQVCRRPERPTVAIFSLEMDRQQIMNRLAAAEASINSQKLKRGGLTPPEWERFAEALGRVGDYALFVDDTATMTVGQILHSAQRLQRETGRLDLVIVDYLGLLRGSRKHENRNQEIAEISRDLKLMAKTLRVPVVVAAQLSREVENRANKRPQLSDLRDSGAQEQDADIVMFLYRDEVYNPNTATPGHTELIIAKHREGPLGTLSLFYSAWCTQFSTMRKTTINLRDYALPDHEE